MRRALLAQGLVGRAAEVAAEAADAEAAGASKNAFAGLGLRVASEHVQMLPVASNLRSLPGYGIRAAAAAAAAAGGASRGRPRGTGRRPRKQGEATPYYTMLYNNPLPVLALISCVCLSRKQAS